MKSQNLEKIRIGLLKVVSEELVDASVDYTMGWMTNSVNFAIRGYVWGESEKVQRQTIKYPANWIEAIKDRWLPRSLRKIYPVKYHCVDIDVTAIYPKFNPIVPGIEYRLVINRDDTFEESGL